MKVIAFVIALAALCVPCFAAADQPAAPADEYFGRMKLSIIGIRNELKLLHERVEGDPVNAEANLKTADLVEDALEDWAQKYPRDSWLQGSFSSLELLYGHIASLDGRLHVARLVVWTHVHLAGSTIADSCDAEAATLFDVPMHTNDAAATSTPDPLDPTTTPAPLASPTPAPSPV
jgi:hypothetical protein